MSGSSRSSGSSDDPRDTDRDSGGAPAAREGQPGDRAQPSGDVQPKDGAPTAGDGQRPGHGVQGSRRFRPPNRGVPVAIPDGLATMAPGARLAAALGDVDVELVSGHDTVDVMTAAYRQSCHERGVFLQAVLETGMRENGSAQKVARIEPGEFAAEEVRAALVWSRRRSNDTFRLAKDVFVRLPQLGAAMLAGNLDEPRAAAFADWTRDLDDAHAVLICDELLTGALAVTVGGLIDQIKKLAIALDPDWAQRRYTAAVRQRRVVGSHNPDGSANVSGQNLPIDRAAAGCHHIDTLARSAKTAGDARPIDTIRADLYLGMLDGTFLGMADDEIITHTLANPFTATDNHDTDTDAGDGPDSSEVPSDAGDDGDDPTGGDHDDPQAGDAGGSNRGGPRSPAPSADQPDSDASCDATQEPVQTPESASDAGYDGDNDRDCDRGGHGKQGTGVAGPERSVACGVRELRMELTTLLGRDDRPGEMPSWCHIPAAVARNLIGRMISAQWRFVICDDQGRPICSGITTRRPQTGDMPRSQVSRGARTPAGQPQGTSGSAGQPQGTSGLASRARDARHGRGGVVELQVRASDLCWLDAAAETGRYRRWASLIADIATRVDAGDVDTDAAAEQVRRRFPTAGLRRLIEVRARYCTHPACRAPAAAGDADHGVEYHKGGPTNSGNLHPPCKHDHRLRHDGGWNVTVSESGQVQWTSPLGRRYETTPPPVIFDLPIWQWETSNTNPTSRHQPAHSSREYNAALEIGDKPPF